MKKMFNKRIAGIILFVSFGLLILFHGLIMIKIIPYTIVWGGQLTRENFVLMSVVSIVISILFMVVIAIKLKYAENNLALVGKIGSWIIFIYLILNTLGNFASGVSMENLIFAPITIVMAIFAFILALSK
jgi:hypothetical protein